MDAIVIAGGTPSEGDPLFPFTQGKPKAMLEICAKPMIQWVLDALEQAETIERIAIIGLDPKDIEGKITGLRTNGPDPSGIVSHAPQDKPSKLKLVIPDQGEMLQNIRTGVTRMLALDKAEPADPQAIHSAGQAGHMLIVSADIPSILPEQVDWVVRTAMQTDKDVYYNVVKQEVMEKRFPGSNRSYVHLKDMDVCGGDMNVIRSSLVASSEALWEEIIASRKNALKQAALIGYDTLLLLLLRLINLENAVKKVTKRLKLTAEVLVSPYAEVAMDVDKPHQLEIMRADLCKRA